MVEMRGLRRRECGSWISSVLDFAQGRASSILPAILPGAHFSGGWRIHA
jgi:hypothetical protein